MLVKNRENGKQRKKENSCWELPTVQVNAADGKKGKLSAQKPNGFAASFNPFLPQSQHHLNRGWKK
jgi:hypothetical protein